MSSRKSVFWLGLGMLGILGLILLSSRPGSVLAEGGPTQAAGASIDSQPASQ